MWLPLIARWSGGTRGLGVTLAALSITAIVGLLTHGCQNERKPFQCGVPLEGNASVTRTCDGPNEVCICWTHYCARRQSPDHVAEEGNYCESGFRYLRKPFGPPELAGSGESAADGAATSPISPIPIDDDLADCVDVALVEWRVTGTQLCKDSEHAPDTFADDGGTSTGTTIGGGGSGGTTPSGSGGTTSSGGATGGATGGTGGAL